MRNKDAKKGDSKDVKGSSVQIAKWVAIMKTCRKRNEKWKNNTISKWELWKNEDVA